MPVMNIIQAVNSALDSALAADDLSVRVMDAVALRLVRRLEGHTNTLTDVAWGADARITSITVSHGVSSSSKASGSESSKTV
mgnify:CR=1 FL=1